MEAFILETWLSAWWQYLDNKSNKAFLQFCQVGLMWNFVVFLTTLIWSRVAFRCLFNQISWQISLFFSLSPYSLCSTEIHEEFWFRFFLHVNFTLLCLEINCIIQQLVPTKSFDWKMSASCLRPNPTCWYWIKMKVPAVKYCLDETEKRLLLSIKDACSLIFMLERTNILSEESLWISLCTEKIHRELSVEGKVLETYWEKPAITN